MIDIQLIANRLLKELSPLMEAPLIISDHNGFIVAATDESRMNQFHEGVLTVIRDRTTLYISNTQAHSFQGARGEVLTLLSIDEIPLGVLGIEGPIVQVEPYIKIATKVAEMLIERALMSEDYDPEAQLLELFLTELLGGQLTKEAMQQQLKKLNVEDIYDRVALIELDVKTEAVVIRHLIHIQIIHPKLIMARWNVNQIVLLIPKVSRGPLQDALQLIHQKLAKLTQSHVKMGIGNRHPFHLLSLSYQEANSALTICTKERAIVFEEDLKLELLLVESTKKHREEYIARVLGPIMHEPELMMNLDIWMSNDQSLKEVAEQLHIHKNTLKYRIKKIEQLLNVNLHNTADQATLYIALLLYKHQYITK
ncbi:sugar diacid recognition domain-containing protein [Lysinibacillus sp. LZ02]|uniref:sugar diacid recognition domain-containing protein n=1 Tax=Lysinibacillus sp. LZ02 TaxID=3420668 RepID=UPI003D36CDC0